MSQSRHSEAVPSGIEGESEEDFDLSLVWRAWRARWRLVAAGGLVAGVVAFGVASLIPPTYTARALILPPQQQQSSATAALSSLGSLGALAGIAGGTGALKNPGEQYVAFMQSVTVLDGIVEKFKLMQVYDVEFRVDARRMLASRSLLMLGKKDGLISIEVDDRDPRRAADLANAYVDGLRGVTNVLAVSEAQQRRVFFEQKLAEAKEQLIAAQIALQSGGFNQDAIKAEPKSAAESYAKLRGEAMAAEVKLQSLRKLLVDGAPELLQQQSIATALRAEVRRMEQREESRSGDTGGGGYISKYREYKYREVLFELFARQYESARSDEAREGSLVQFVDRATPPERKSKPKRAVIALGAALITGLLLSVFVVFRHFRSQGASPTAGPC